MPDRRTALIVGGAAALILALLVAWLVQDNLRYGGVAVQPQANAQPANTGRIQPTPGAGSAPGRPTTPATSKPGQNVGAPASGPISELDRQLLIKVRQADLWELRAGALASDKAASDSVTRAGLHVMEGQTRLDAQVREAAQAVQVGIPDQATPDQRTWIRQLQDGKGEAFDRFFVNQLRRSYGSLFLLIAQVRATTQNSVIRDLAIGATSTIADHMRVLEDTGLVDSETLRGVAATIR
jgi:predicted outer membrane protein